MLGWGFWGDDFGGYVVEGFPAVFLLAGDDEDAFAGAGFAIAGGVDACYFGHSAGRGGKEVEVGNIPAFAAA